ncbi:MAG: flagellar hook-associated protein FlgK [Gammaproteobacteria bacterium]
MTILDNALSGILAFQRALQTTSHNISNVNTPGFSRQTNELTTRTPQFLGNITLGTGVVTNDIRRSVDNFIIESVRAAQTNFSEQEGFQKFAGLIDGILADPSVGLNTGLDNFFASINNLFSSPASQPARATFLSQTNLLVNRFATLNAQLDQQNSLLNNDLRNITTEINNLSSSLAQLNDRITTARNAAPDLLDQRDQLLRELASYVNVSTVEQIDGAVNIFIGSGQSLVVGNRSNTLGVTASTEDPGQFDIVLQTSNGPININTSIQGGELQGILNARDQVLIPTVNQIGLIAIGIAQTFNAQHQLGLDLNDNLGGLLFNDINSTAAITNRVIANSGNAGNAVLTGTITNVANLTASDYRITVTTGPNYVVTRLSDNTSTTFGGFPISIDGVTVALSSGSANVGDNFLLRPTRAGANDFQLNITNTSNLAFAAPIRTSNSTANVGTGAISAGVVVDTTTSAFTTTPGQLTPPIRIEFLSATSYQLVNVTTSAVIEGPIVYDPTQVNAVFPTPGAFDPGYRVDISGAPVTGDNFAIEYNNGGVGDNRNALLLADLQINKTLSNGTASFQDAYSDLVADIGLETNEANVNFEATQVLLQQAEAQRESISGVNLDEEAANLIKFQNAYQAAAQVFSIARTLFDTVLSVLGR